MKAEKKQFVQILIAAAILAGPFASLARGDDVGGLIERADRLDAQEQTSAAIELLLQADKESPNSPKIFVRLAQDYSDQIDNVKDRATKLSYANLSMDYAKRAVREAPNSSEAHAALSVAYGKMTDFVDNKTKIEYSKVVKSEAEKSVELNPKNDNALLVLARWNLDMSTLNPVLKSFAQVFYGQLPSASKEKALDYFQRAISAAPQRVIYHAEYAQALEALGRKEEAKAEWRKVRDLRAIDSREGRFQSMAKRIIGNE
jgi:tetratricopeptide (TPR) repeat protein